MSQIHKIRSCFSPRIFFGRLEMSELPALKWLIFGCGGVGGYFGARIAQVKGQRVSYIATWLAASDSVTQTFFFGCRMAFWDVWGGGMLPWNGRFDCFSDRWQGQKQSPDISQGTRSSNYQHLWRCAGSLDHGSWPKPHLSLLNRWYFDILMLSEGDSYTIIWQWYEKDMMTIEELLPLGQIQKKTIPVLTPQNKNRGQPT